MRRRSALPAALLLLAGVASATAGLAVARPAVADRPPLSVSVDGAPFSTHPGRVWQVAELVPGASVTALLGLRSGVADATATTLQAVPTGDAGPDALERSLVITVASSDADGGAGTRLWTGTADRLRSTLTLGTALPPGGDAYLRVTAAVPTAAGNDIATSSYDFGLRIALTDAGLGVAAVDIGRDGSRDRHGVDAAGSRRLGYTGVPLALLVLAAALCLASGATVLATARRATRRRAPATAR